ncbi:MAG: hypothetical protein C0592_08095 [Marinilabiliales bacterium]|nr:MAG: hypothetical protein C0592_08095 [Marinilabiliales bacterium]
MHYKCNIEDLPRFFILGRPRSGTTMLRTMLDAHPNIVVPPEFPVLSCVRKMTKEKWNEKEISRFVAKASRCYKFSFIKISAEELKHKLLAYYRSNGKMNLKLALIIMELSYSSPFPKDTLLMLGNKNPGYSMHVEKLRTLFPDACFIFLFRHILSVQESTQNVNFELRWPAFLAWRWKKSVQRAFAERSKHPEYSQIIRYEDLVANHEKVLKDICTFVGVPYSKSMLSFNDEAKLKDVFDDELYGVHSSLLLSPEDANLKNWSEKNYSRKQKISIAWAGNMLKMAGYEVSETPGFWFYIIGIPSVIIARSLLVIAMVLNKLSFGRFPRHINAILAQIIYKNPNKNR